MDQIKDYLRSLSDSPHEQVMIGTEILLILEMLDAKGNNVSVAARAMQMSRATLNNKIHRYGIEHRLPEDEPHDDAVDPG